MVVVADQEADEENVLLEGPGVEQLAVLANEAGSGLAFAGGLPEGV